MSSPRIPWGAWASLWDTCHHHNRHLPWAPGRTPRVGSPRSAVPSSTRTTVCHQLTRCQAWRAGCSGPHLSPTCCLNWPDMTVRWTFLYQEATRSCKEETSSEPWTRPLELEPSTRAGTPASCQLHSLHLFLQLGISNTNTLFTRCTYLPNLPRLPSNGLFLEMLTLLSIFLKYTIVLPVIFYCQWKRS